jgi:DNA-binding transcriptional LysR family regulator
VDRLDAFQTYVRVVESGSFSAAARELGVGQSAVSKQIAALEAQLGAELLWRSSRTISVTEAGKDFYESCIRLLEDFDAAVSRAQRSHSAPKGLVRLMASPNFSRLYIAPHMPEFLALYPEISLELVVSNTPTNLIEDGIDLWIHGFELSDSNLIVKKIAETSAVTVATPTYLKNHGIPKHPRELDQHFGIYFCSKEYLASGCSSTNPGAPPTFPRPVSARMTANTCARQYSHILEWQTRLRGSSRRRSLRAKSAAF